MSRYCGICGSAELYWEGRCIGCATRRSLEPDPKAWPRDLYMMVLPPKFSWRRLCQIDLPGRFALTSAKRHFLAVWKELCGGADG